MKKTFIVAVVAAIVMFVGFAAVCFGSGRQLDRNVWSVREIFILPQAPLPTQGTVDLNLGKGEICGTIIVKLRAGTQVVSVIRDSASFGKQQRAVLTKTTSGTRYEWALSTFPEVVDWWNPAVEFAEYTTQVSEMASSTGFTNRGFVIALDDGSSIVFDENKQSVWTTKDGRQVVKINGIIAVTP